MTKTWKNRFKRNGKETLTAFIVYIYIYIYIYCLGSPHTSHIVIRYANRSVHYISENHCLTFNILTAIFHQQMLLCTMFLKGVSQCTSFSKIS